MIYLDWAATAPPDILGTVAPADEWANPSSIHAAGVLAKNALERARTEIAACVQSPPGSIAFTSGGTESDAIPLLAAIGRTPPTFVASSIEHPAIDSLLRRMETLGAKVIAIRPGEDGVLRAGDFADAVDSLAAKGHRASMVICMAVNNEIGSLQPIGEIGAALAAKGGSRPKFHCDAVQAFGKMPFAPMSLGVDTAAISAHKLGGPRGIGALYHRRSFEPLVSGGAQEHGIRPGTENVAGARAFASIATNRASSLAANLDHASFLCARLYEGISTIAGCVPIPTCRTAVDSRYSPWIAALSFPGVSGEAMTRSLSDSGIMISVGSACSSTAKERRVLSACGIDADLAMATVRVSFGPTTTAADVDAFLETASRVYRKFRA
jgi:cysteine desulfurase